MRTLVRPIGRTADWSAGARDGGRSEAKTERQGWRELIPLPATHLTKCSPIH